MKWDSSPLVIGLVISLASLSSAGVAQTTSDASDQAAYAAAMKCYVVAGHASQERTRAGDPDKAAMYESKAHASFDVAVKFGRAVGRNGSQIEADILATQERELPRIVADMDYNRQSAGTCKALGLL